MSNGHFHLQGAPRGEVFVWLCSMGLAVGLAMTAGLLILIVWNGAKALFPDRIVQATVAPEEEGGEPTQIVGEVVKRQRKKSMMTGEWYHEWQFYVGNKEHHPNFRYELQDDLGDLTQPESVIKIERLESGPAIGFPLRLDVKGEGTFEADAAEFEAKLHQVVAEVARRRQEIDHLARVEIGRISRRMEKINVEKRARSRARRAGEEVLDDTELLARETELQSRYDTLAAELGEKRQRQHDHTLHYRLANGSEHELAVGEIVHFYYPNRLSRLARVGLMIRNIWAFLSEDPREANTEGGIFPALFGTFIMTVMMSLLVTPFGVIAALYMREYARQGPMLRTVRIAVNNLAGVPSIVFGVFGLGFFVYLVGGTIDELFFGKSLPTPTFGTGGILWASLTLALLTLPVVIVASEEALAAVPLGMREASLACGASKWQTIWRIVLPAAAPGIMTGMILAMARGAGEVAPLMLVGVVKIAPALPINTTPPFVHLDQKFMHLGFHIYDLGFQSPDSEAAIPMVFATTLLLILLVVVLNLAGIVIRERLRRKYASGAF